MSEKSEIEKLLIESSRLEGAQITDSELEILDKVIQDYSPEIVFLYQFREDQSEEQQIKTGRLHENRILGIILKFYLEGKKKITTGEVEQEYKRYFKEIARSTISTYLNMLKKESTLYKERDGRIVYYIFYEDPPIGIKPFWFTRIFCIVPSYFDRARFFANLYMDSKKYILQYINEYNSKDKEILIRNFKFITGLIILNILKNRSSKCILCQFSKREIYNKLEEIIQVAVKDRSDVLPEELLYEFIEKYAEIPIFNGISINSEYFEDKIAKDIFRCADLYKKDLDFQITVSLRRRDLRLKQKLALEKQDTDT
ncbi:MAG: hypothetical protein JSV62_08325 [Promethearchaeota archaeon]|nr:MAG: hypothetical protein JSV62_08325 [Candidatus Lokiarchaeota archaeon]